MQTWTLIYVGCIALFSWVQYRVAESWNDLCGLYWFVCSAAGRDRPPGNTNLLADLLPKNESLLAPVCMWLDRSQSLFYFVPQDSHRQAGSSTCDTTTTSVNLRRPIKHQQDEETGHREYKPTGWSRWRFPTALKINLLHKPACDIDTTSVNVFQIR